jgi:hypothetical protein
MQIPGRYIRIKKFETKNINWVLTAAQISAIIIEIISKE